MARYYLDVHNGECLVRDNQGTEFDGLDAAVQGAAISAGEISQSLLAKGSISDVVIQVRNGHNQRVCTVTASIKIERHDPPPHASHPGSA